MSRVLINGIAAEYLSVFDRGLHYGDGLFETIASPGGRPLFIDHHMDRMERGAGVLDIPCPDRRLFLDDIRRLLADSSGNCVIKLILTRGQGRRGYRYDRRQLPTRVCMLASWPEHVDAWQRHGVSTQFCETTVSGNPGACGIKSLNRLENVLASRELRDAVDEGFLSDADGNVIEGTMSNFFAVSGDVLVTPDLSRGGIQGIMRDRIIDIAHEAGIERETRHIKRDELLGARELFICNSVIGLCPVRQLEQAAFNTGEITTTIRTALLRRMRADAEAFD